MNFGDLYPLPGDIIEFKRGKGVYYHVGIADGDYGIYHFCGEPGTAPEFGVRSMKLKARFRHDKLREVARGCLMRINNSEDFNKMSNEKSVNVSEIIQRCEDHVGKGYGTYSILRNNCEHKATEMRYGFASSEQAQKAKSILASVGVPALKHAVKLTSSRLFGAGLSTPIPETEHSSDLSGTE